MMHKKGVGEIIIASIIFLYSLLIIGGWLLGIEALTQGALLINMKFSTAVCFLMSAICLYFMAQAILGKKEIAQIVIPGATLLIGLIMVALLAAGIFGVKTGLEDLFVKGSFIINPAGPGMPAIPTMISFVLFCFAGILALFATSKVKKYIFGFGFFISLIGLIALSGHILGLPFLYFQLKASLSPIAISTSALFILLGMGVVLCAYHIEDTKHEN